jgi:hypothetical protein
VVCRSHGRGLSMSIEPSDVKHATSQPTLSAVEVGEARGTARRIDCAPSRESVGNIPNNADLDRGEKPRRDTRKRKKFYSF